MHVRCALKPVQVAAEGVGMERVSSRASLRRQESPLDRDLLARLLDEHFDGRPGLMQEFPLLIRESLAGRGFVWAQPELGYVAHAAWKPLELVADERRVLAAGIGLVTTHEAFRGCGLATDLVQACLDQARDEGLCWALLFSAPRSLYSRLGFVSAGLERITLLEGSPPTPVVSEGVVSEGVAPDRVAPDGVPRDRVASGEGTPRSRRAGLSDVPRLLELLERHRLRVRRSLDEFEALVAIPCTRVFVAEQAGVVEAYCVEGKGRDLRGYVHEWAGSPELLPALFEHVREQCGGSLRILSPESEPPPVRGQVLHSGGFVLARSLTAESPRESPGCDSRSAADVQIDATKPLDLDFYVWGLDSI